MIWRGVVIALCAAVVHTAIDALRKTASAALPTHSLVCLVAILDAVISCGFVAATGGFKRVAVQDSTLFTVAVLSSSLLLLLSKFLYQHALAVSQLSLTVPYLSFTPTFLLATAYVFLGEEPTPLGLIGVAVVTAGGYLLARQDIAGAPASATASSAADKTLPIVRPTAHHKKSASLSKPVASWFGLDAAPAGGGSASRHTSDAGALLQSDTSTLLHSVSEDPSSNLNSHLNLNSKGSSQRLQDLADPTHGKASSTVASKVLAARPIRTVVSVSDIDAAEDGHTNGIGGDGKAHGNGVAHGAMATTPKVVVAFMWSVTASMDKLGVLHSPSVWVYLAMQKTVIGGVSALYLIWHAPQAFKSFWSRSVRLLFVISVLETLAVVLFLYAIRYLFVSYVVAIKRCNILLSVLIGGLIWKEKIAHRLPYICLMLLGMTLIVLDPDSGDIHTTSHA